jgi:hypothetical protein
MRKVILALALTSAATFANDTTIDATMQLMRQGMEQIQKGFMYNNKVEIKKGIETLENSNAIFKNVDVSVFIEHNNKIQATKNINHNLEDDLKSLKKSIVDGEYADATDTYGKVLNDCVSCHTIVRGW